MTRYEDLAYTRNSPAFSDYRDCSECGDEWPRFELRNGYCRACIEIMEEEENQTTPAPQAAADNR